MASSTSRSKRASSAVQDDVGQSLRAERERRGISLRNLAKQVEISPSALSQIETGRSRPSVSTLYALVTALGMSLDELFGGGPAQAVSASANATAEPAVKPASARTAVTPQAPAGLQEVPATPVSDGSGRLQREALRTAIDLDSGVRWERLTADPDPDVDFLFVRYDVGGASSRDRRFVRHAGREYGLVLSGQLRVTTGFETQDLGPGDSISFDSSVPHLLENIGDAPATAVWVVIGRHADPRVPDPRADGQDAAR